MWKEIPYFTIEGAFGGNQDWFTNIVMNMGGCGAATACDCCIYFAKYQGLDPLYPFDKERLSIADYRDFSQIMKPYIRPRVGGVKNPQWFIDGFQRYIQDVNERNGCRIHVDMSVFDGTRSVAEARTFIMEQIDQGMPVPCLLLRHQDVKQFKDYTWHWFLLVGYEDLGEDLRIKTATYGEAEVFSLNEMWDTGYEEKGGLIRLNVRKLPDGNETGKTVTVRGVEIGAGTPKICVPIVGKSREEILAQAEEIKGTPADLAEWRADWYEDVGSGQKVEELLKELRDILRDMPILFTFRRKAEGGEKEIPSADYEKLLGLVMETGAADLIDVELSAGEGILKRAVAAARDKGVKVIASSHDFEKTPEKDEILARLCRMQELGADILKIAVMPKTRKDVLTLLEATEEMTRVYADRPVITMSMSKLGAVSRVCGEVFGSAVTFGALERASAPGQIEIGALRKMLLQLGPGYF